jgi:hypothetical protein
MATQKKSSATSAKITFGKRREGKHKKNYGPKDSGHKKYRGQGK